MTAVRLLAVANVLLAAFGLVYDPAALRGGGYLALLGVVVAQGLCVALMRWGPLSTRTASPAAIRIGATTGLVLGVLYGAEVLAEYLSAAITDASVLIGWIIVSGLVAGIAVAATTATVRLRSVRAGVTAAVYCAIFEYLVWYPAVLICYYLFRTSGALERVWRAEGTYDDFARSGMTDIRAFVLQDFWGAGFFHLLAGLVIAGIFGTSAALAVRAVQRLTGSTGSRRDPRPQAGYADQA
jgi:hypothetical protein